MWWASPAAGILSRREFPCRLHVACARLSLMCDVEHFAETGSEDLSVCLQQTECLKTHLLATHLNIGPPVNWFYRTQESKTYPDNFLFLRCMCCAPDREVEVLYGNVPLTARRKLTNSPTCGNTQLFSFIDTCNHHVPRQFAHLHTR